MKRIAAILTLALFATLPLHAAEPPPSAQDQQLAALVKQLQAQNAAMAQNQAAIETKLATVAEAVRIARVFASRGAR